MSRLRTVRVGLLVLVCVLALPLAADFVTRGQAATTEASGWNSTVDTDVQHGPDGHLVYVVDAVGPGQLVVVNRTSGEELYNTTERQLYHDVDPAPGRTSVSYVASDIRGEANCPADVPSPCVHNVIERLNYSTGERELVYERYVEYNGSSTTHDVDRIDEHRFLVGDIYGDRIFVANVTTDTIEWTWNVSAAYNRSTGGLPGDWTHLNDVEVLREDLYMVNLRNQDSVVFVDREEGILPNRTLGTDDDHDTLYEPHNPDFIPAASGGPAILIADSENNRVVEYQYRNNSWNRTWRWTDATLQWPRDADRLPNNNTLVTDTHGTRLLEVRPNGSIAWQMTVPRGVYDAELLSTGDESTAGPSMARIRGNETVTADGPDLGVGGSLQKAFLGVFPPLVLHGFLYVLPSWITPLAGALLLVDLVIVVGWAIGEGGWFAYRRLRG